MPIVSPNDVRTETKSDKNQDKRDKNLAKMRFSLDLDGDGDVDSDDAKLLGYWTFRVMQLFFDVTLFIVPVGALIGSVITTVSLIFIQQQLSSVRSDIEGLVASFRERGLLPPWSSQTSVLGLDLSTAETWIQRGAMALIGIDLLVVLNGLYVGLNRASRKAIEFQDDRVCGCKRTKVQSLDLFGRSLCCCCRCGAHVLQASWALIGTIILWVSKVLGYLLSIAALNIGIVLMLFRAYCERIRPLVNMGIGFTGETLTLANQTLLFAAGYAADLNEVYRPGVEEYRSTIYTVQTTLNQTLDAMNQAASTVSQTAAMASMTGNVATSMVPSFMRASIQQQYGVDMTVPTTWDETTQQSNMLFQLSPIEDLLDTLNNLVGTVDPLLDHGGNVLNLASSQMGLISSLLDQVRGLLRNSSDYTEFLDHLCQLTEKLPYVCFYSCAALGACIIGQIIVSQYHLRYYTLWYYEQAMRQRRRARKRNAQLAASSQLPTEEADADEKVEEEKAQDATSMSEQAKVQEGSGPEC